MRTLIGITLLSVSCFAAPKGPARLAEAAKNGDKTAVASLLQQNADVNAPEADGTTALAWAARHDDLEMADRLIKAGADVKAANRYGVTALYLACLNGSAAMIEKLLKAGADANASVTEGETALMTAARSGSVEAARVLLDHGAKVDARESWHSQTALMWAVSEKHPEMVKELIAQGADVNAVSHVNEWERQNTSEPREKWLPLGGLTPLLFAAREGCVDCARILIEKGAQLDITDPDGISPVLIATINGHYDAAVFLLGKGANPNLADRTGRTALFSAVDFHTMPQSNRPSPKDTESEESSLNLITTLLAKGADVNAQLKSQQPYRTKLDRGDDTMLTTGTTPLLRAAKAGDVEVIRLLLAKGADHKLATRAGITPLMAAAGVGTKEEDTTGRFKTESDAIESIKLLLDAGADINAVNSTGQSALYGAALKGYDQIVRFLAEHGAKLDLKDRQGKTALDAALGLAGGSGGFDGSRKDVHDSTAALLKQLMTSAPASAQ